MRLIALHIFLIMFVLQSANAQYHKIKPVKHHAKKTNLSLGAGLTKSMLFLGRNVKENNDATGYTAHLTYGGSKLVRVSAEYTHYKPINIEPTWYNINAGTIEGNVHFIARFDSSNAYFYPLVGLSYNHFSGFFTGKNDFMGLGQKYTSNSVVTTNWLGVNFGTGFEYILGPVSLFADYRMRVGFYDGRVYQVNIMDICAGFGIKYNIAVPTLYKLVKNSRKRYYLDLD